MCSHDAKEASDDCLNGSWKSEAWIDAVELEPVRIDTHLAFKVPWAVRTFPGTNLKQKRLHDYVPANCRGRLVPSSYGTEFQMDVLFFYKRTIAMNLESAGQSG